MGNRQRTPAELLEDARALSRRLTRALDDWDAGNDDSARDVGGYVRTLLAYGKGDGLLRHLASIHRLDLPPVRLFARPDVGPRTRIAVGGMPADPEQFGDDIRSVSVEEWLAENVVDLEDAARKHTSWNQFIVDYGNTFSAHASRTVPEVLERVQVFRGPSGHMGGYIVRAAAVIAERVASQVLAQIDGVDAFTSPRRIHPDGITVVAFAIGGSPPYWHGFGMSVSVPGTFTVLEMPMDERTVRVVWSWDGGPTGGSMSIDFDALDA